MSQGGYDIDINILNEITGLKFVKSAVETPTPVSKNLDIKNYMNYGKRPAHISPEEWEAYKTDMDYKKATKGFGGEKGGLTKEEYKEYTEDIQEKIDNGESLDIEPGEDCNLHINCGCYIEDTTGLWVVSDNNTCDECYAAQEAHNSKIK